MSATTGLKSGQSDRKRNFGLMKFHKVIQVGKGDFYDLPSTEKI
jgi:hypothetical protein